MADESTTTSTEIDWDETPKNETSINTNNNNNNNNDTNDLTTNNSNGSNGDESNGIANTSTQVEGTTISPSLTSITPQPKTEKKEKKEKKRKRLDDLFYIPPIYGGGRRHTFSSILAGWTQQDITSEQHRAERQKEREKQRQTTREIMRERIREMSGSNKVMIPKSEDCPWDFTRVTLYPDQELDYAETVVIFSKREMLEKLNNYKGPK